MLLCHFHFALTSGLCVDSVCLSVTYQWVEKGKIAVIGICRGSSVQLNQSKDTKSLGSLLCIWEGEELGREDGGLEAYHLLQPHTVCTGSRG